MIYYRSLNNYLRETYGEKMYKLALDGGFSCPNRDGRISDRGCSFCLKGSGAFSASVNYREEDSDKEVKKAVFTAIEEAKGILGEKTAGSRFIAYFQSYTGTYAPLTKLKRIYSAALSHPEIEVLSVATRPDCLGDDVLKLLSGLNMSEEKPSGGAFPEAEALSAGPHSKHSRDLQIESCPENLPCGRHSKVWIELGLQTIHEKTAEKIRRGYPLSVYDEAMKKLRALGIPVIVHMILGLPGETPEMMVDTARYIAKSGASGIKFQLLHILKGTDMAEDYEKGLFEPLSMEEYIDILSECVSVLPPDIIVHRLTGDGARKDLLAPLWSLDKKRVLNEIHKRMQPL